MNDVVSRTAKLFGDVMRAVMLGQIPKEKLIEELDGHVAKVVPNFSADQFPFVLVAPDAAEILNLRQQAIDAVEAWDAAGRPQVTSPYWGTAS